MYPTAAVSGFYFAHPEARYFGLGKIDKDQLEEKDGNIYIYYRKSNMSDTAYNAGRFNSKNKYAPVYGFLECRMRIWALSL